MLCKSRLPEGVGARLLTFVRVVHTGVESDEIIQDAAVTPMAEEPAAQNGDAPMSPPVVSGQTPVEVRIPPFLCLEYAPTH
jgi:hypothetical protein